VHCETKISSDNEFGFNPQLGFGFISGDYGFYIATFSDNVMGANCRNMLGEDLGPLNVKELDQLERQLESTLKQIRSIKVTQAP